MSKEIIRQYILHLHAIYKQKTVKRKIASMKAFATLLLEEEVDIRFVQKMLKQRMKRWYNKTVLIVSNYRYCFIIPS